MIEMVAKVSLGSRGMPGMQKWDHLCHLLWEGRARDFELCLT